MVAVATDRRSCSPVLHAIVFFVVRNGIEDALNISELPHALGTIWARLYRLENKPSADITMFIAFE